MAYTAALNGTNGHAAHDSALDVGDAARTHALEEENDMLRDKIGSASQRFADYENEIRVLQAKVRQAERRDAEASSPPAEAARPEKPGISRFGSFIGSRKPANLTVTTPPSGRSAREQELETAFIKEQTARIAAEKKVREVNAEIEELSATLFQHANEMVATERRQNAALKERLDNLERAGGKELERHSREIQGLNEKIKVMEQREGDRRRRLERLEAAQRRIDRVRAILLPR